MQIIQRKHAHTCSHISCVSRYLLYVEYFIINIITPAGSLHHPLINMICWNFSFLSFPVLTGGFIIFKITHKDTRRRDEWDEWQAKERCVDGGVRKDHHRYFFSFLLFFSSSLSLFTFFFVIQMSLLKLPKGGRNFQFVVDRWRV